MILRGPSTLTGGVVTLNNADSLIQVDGACTIDNDLDFTADSNSSKGLDFNDDVTLSGDITMSADPIFDIAANTVLYQGAAVDVSANTLKFLGTGTFDNSGNNFNLNRATSLIDLAGTTVSKVNQEEDVNVNKGIFVRTSAATITTFTSGADSRIDLSANLTITNNFNLGGNTMVLRGPNTLDGGVVTLNNGDSLIQIAGSCTIDNDLDFTADSNSSKGLDIDDDVTISGDITMSADPIFDIANNKTLQFSGSNNISISTNKLTFTGGTGASDEGIIDCSGSMLFTTGTLSILNNTQIKNDIYIQGDATLDISANKTLDYDGRILDVSGNNTLTLTGDGLFENANAMNLNTGTLDVSGNITMSGDLTIGGNSTISVTNDIIFQVSSSTNIDVSGNTLTLSGDTGATDEGTFDSSGNLVFRNNGSLNVDNNIQLDSDIVMDGDMTIDIANGKTLDYDGAQIDVSSNTLSLTGGTGVNDEGTFDCANGITFSMDDGKLSVLNNMELDGDITMSADITLDLSANRTLDYDGAAINIGANTLSIIGGGTMSNDNNIILNNADSLINIKTDASTTVSKVSTSANVTGTNKGIDIDVNSTITNLTVSNTCPIRIASGKTLSGAISLQGGSVNLTEVGTLGSDLTFGAFGTTAGDYLLDIDNNCTMTGDLDVSGNGTICVMDISNNRTFSYEGNDFAVGAYTLQLKGGGGATAGIFNNDGNGDITFSTGTLDIEESVDISGSLTTSGSMFMDISSNKTLTYKGDSIALGTNTLTVYNDGTIDNDNVFTMTGGDPSLGTPTGGIIDFKTDSSGASGSGGATINNITITGTAEVTNQINTLFTNTTTNGVIGNVTATVTDTATNCNTLSTDNNDVITVTINDVAGTSVNATTISGIGNKTSLVPTVTNAITIAGTQAEIEAALLTASTKVTATTSVLNDSTYNTNSVTGGQYANANSRANSASNAGTVNLNGLGIANEKTRHQILDCIFRTNTALNSIKANTADLSLTSAVYNNVTNTTVQIYKGTTTGQTVDLINFAADVALYASLVDNNDKIKFKASIGDTILTYTVTKTSAKGASGTYKLVGNNKSKTYNSGDTAKIGNNPTFTIIFGGVAIAAGAGSSTSSGISGGDPYITPVYGPTYKLPNANAFYRLYENNDVLINGEVKEISNKKKEKMIEYYKNKGFVNLETAITDIYVFRSVYLSIGTHKLAFNLNNIKWVTTTHSKDFFKIDLPKGTNLKSEWFVGEKDGAAKITIKWTHNGIESGLNLFFFNDPQKENGISLHEMPCKHSIGLLIRNYKPEIFKLENLTVLDSKEEELENTEDKLVFENIKEKNEHWVKF
jgi:hypothetical protein